MNKSDRRLIEAGFPCHQVGAETQREQSVGLQPPVNRLHVWWARRPLTPSRAAIVASLDPEGTNPEKFIRQLGIEKNVALVNGQIWTLTGNLLNKIVNKSGDMYLKVDATFVKALQKENDRRKANRQIIELLRSKAPEIAPNPILSKWEKDSTPLPPINDTVDKIPVQKVVADPSHINDRLIFSKEPTVKKVLGKELKWDPEDLYAYGRAFQNVVPYSKQNLTVLDPTAGGGSIPFEAMRLGFNITANELNPVATAILYATLDYPARFGNELLDDIAKWGNKLIGFVEEILSPFSPFPKIPQLELQKLTRSLIKAPTIIEQYSREYDQNGLIYCRQVICPNCEGDAPLLNTSWLSKDAANPWGVQIIPKNGAVTFETFQAIKGKGPKDQDPNFSTINRGIGQCIHCKQAIDSDEIKRQARGESQYGAWKDRLYAIAAVRLEPKLDQHGNPLIYTSGSKKGTVKTRKVRYFRPPNESDLKALREAESMLKNNWSKWDAEGLIPTEKFPNGNDMRPALYGMSRWCDMFTPRQLLCHLSLIEHLNTIKPIIIQEIGEERGKAVITYLQFVIDKGVDYNSKQTRWHFSRGAIVGTFGRHDFSLKWTFGEMIFTGPNSGIRWALSQVLDAYKGLAELVEPVRKATNGAPPVQIINGTGAHIGNVADQSVDLVCMDPPYYNNVQYAELSDYFYVWQKRTLRDLYPDLYARKQTDKKSEAVANPARDGSAKAAKAEYERMMGEIFQESHRVLKGDGLLTLMFTHKTQDAWETLTRSLIESGWIITACFPVESEGENSMHQRDMAAAASSMFITCRKRKIEENAATAVWQGFGGQGIQKKVETAVLDGLGDFKTLRLNPVDEMVACYGRALHVLSENWPVMDGDEPVSPTRAMNEASRVVAQNRVGQITNGKITAEDLDAETSMALTIYGIWGHNDIAYDDVLTLSRSLGIRLESKTAGYQVSGNEIGINTEASGRGKSKTREQDNGFAAPLLRKGSKVRLALPEERDDRRFNGPQTDWDRLHGVIAAYRKGDVPVARAYLVDATDGNAGKIIELLTVWTAEAADPDLRKEGQAILYGLRQ